MIPQIPHVCSEFLKLFNQLFPTHPPMKANQKFYEHLTIHKLFRTHQRNIQRHNTEISYSISIIMISINGLYCESLKFSPLVNAITRNHSKQIQYT